MRSDAENGFVKEDLGNRISFNNTIQGISEFAEHVKQLGYEGAVAVCESTANYWVQVHDVLEENGINALIAHPTKTKIIAQARLKDDTLDSNVLANLLRANLVYGTFVPEGKDKELKTACRMRMNLVVPRTSFTSKVHAILAKYDCTSEHEAKDVFSNK